MNFTRSVDFTRLIMMVALLPFTVLPASSQKPELLLQSGHRAMIRSLALSADGKFLASAGADRIIIIWDLAAGKQILSLRGHEDWIFALAFSSNSNFLASGSYDGAVKIWDLSNARVDTEISSIKPYNITSLSFSPDGNLLAISSADKIINLWDVKGRTMKAPLQGHQATVTKVLFGANNHSLASASLDKTVRFWNLSTMTQTFSTTPLPAGVTDISFSPNFQFHAISFENDYVAVIENPDVEGRALIPPIKVSTDPRHVDFRSWRRNFTKTGSTSLKFLSNNQLAVLDSFQIRIWNITANRIEFSKDIESLEGGYAVTSSGKDQRLIYSDGLNVELLDVALQQARSLKGGFASFDAITFYPDGSHLIGLFGNAVAIWGKKKSFNVGAVGSTMNALNNERRVYIWSQRLRAEIEPDNPRRADEIQIRGEQRWILKGHTKNVRALAINPDETILASCGVQGTVLWDVRTRRPIKWIPGDARLIQFSQDGSLLAIAFTDRTIAFFNISSMRMTPVRIKASIIHTIRFSPNGELIAGTVIEKTDYPSTVRKVNGRFSPVTMDDEIEILTKVNRPTLKVWKVATGELVHTFSLEDTANPSNVESLRLSNKSNFEPLAQAVFDATHSIGNAAGLIAFSVDSALVAARTMRFSSNNNQVKIWNVVSGQELYSLRGYSGSVQWITFSPRGNVFVSAGADTTAKLWDLKTGRELATIVPFDESDWVVHTPDGRFDTNRDLDELNNLSWRWPTDPLHALSPKVFMRDYDEPGLLTKILIGDELKPVRDLSTLNRAQPLVSIKAVTRDSLDSVQVEVEVSSTVSKSQTDLSGLPMQSGVFDVRLLRDKQVVASSNPNEALTGLMPNSVFGAERAIEKIDLWRKISEVKLDPQGKATVVFRNVRLPQRSQTSEVTFTAYAFNSDRVTSETSATFVYKLPAARTSLRPRAYVITVGVDANESGWNLEFAAKSATDMQRVLREKLKSEYEVISVQLLSTREPYGPRLAVNDATSENIRDVLAILAGQTVPAHRRQEIPNVDALHTALPDDLVVLYMASHGYADRYGDFYVIPYNTGAPSGITASVLNDCFRGIGSSRTCAKAESFLNHSISINNLANWWRGIDAGESILILDSCYSAAVLDRQTKLGPMGDSGFVQLAYDKGMLILTAAQPDKPAIAAASRAGTLLSRALISTFADRPSQPLKKWLAYTETLVPIMYRVSYSDEDENDAQLPVLLDVTSRSRSANQNSQPSADKSPRRGLKR